MTSNRRISAWLSSWILGGTNGPFLPLNDTNFLLDFLFGLGGKGEGLFLTATSRSRFCLGPAIHFLTVLLHKKLYLISVSAAPLLGPRLPSITLLSCRLRRRPVLFMKVPEEMSIAPLAPLCLYQPCSIPSGA